MVKVFMAQMQIGGAIGKAALSYIDILYSISVHGCLLCINPLYLCSSAAVLEFL